MKTTLQKVIICAISALILSSNTVLASEARNLLDQIVQRDWQFRLQEEPELASFLDVSLPDTRFSELTESARQRRLHFLKLSLKQLDGLTTAELNSEEQINWRILRDQTLNRIADLDTASFYLLFNSDTQFWADWPRMAQNRQFTDKRHYQEYLEKLRALPQAMQNAITVMKAGLDKGISQPQAVLSGREASIQQQLVSTPEKSDFYAPFLQWPDSISESERTQLKTEALRVIRKQVIPAYQRLFDFFVGDYKKRARLQLAASDLPDGKRFYAAQIYQYTTLDWSASRIHQTGLDEVARIRQEMEKIKTDVQFNGDLNAFLNHLRTDPQFFAKTPKELLAEASYVSKRIDGQLPKYFGVFPRQPYGVMAVPEAIAPYYTTGRYAGSNDPKQAGFYWVNTSKLESRPLWAIPALTLHEAVPGHHLQNALAAEQGEQPLFRRYSYISAFGEGWALYGEKLGVEMGIYETPYQHFGRLVYEMWRACRLVVDTGIHDMHWTRAQALDYMQQNTALSVHEITTEVDRYISWPAQALSYKLGEIKIRELRAHAEKELGGKFDLRAFHDTVLKLGSVPLSVLEERVRVWIDEQRQKS